MGYLIRAKGCPGAETPARFITTRWRSDDPWGAVWRCLYECMQPLLRWPPGDKPELVCTLEITVTFEPDKEDFVSGLFPTDPLDPHRTDKPHSKRKSNHGEIPKD